MYYVNIFVLIENHNIFIALLTYIDDDKRRLVCILNSIYIP